MDKTLAGYNYCVATHPKEPNDLNNSRGRKYHVTLDGKLSLCKCIVTQLIGSRADVYGEDGHDKHPELTWAPTQYDQGMCGNCRNIAKQRDIEVERMEY